MSGIVGRSSINGTDLKRGFTPAGAHPDGALPRPATGTLYRLSVRLRRRGLDRQLAAGIDPDTSPDLELSACGVALALELLTDGTGPLYDPGAEDLLGAAVWSSADSWHT